MSTQTVELTTLPTTTVPVGAREPVFVAQQQAKPIQKKPVAPPDVTKKEEGLGAGGYIKIITIGLILIVLVWSAISFNTLRNEGGKITSVDVYTAFLWWNVITVVVLIVLLLVEIFVRKKGGGLIFFLVVGYGAVFVLLLANTIQFQILADAPTEDGISQGSARALQIANFSGLILSVFIFSYTFYRYGRYSASKDIQASISSAFKKQK